MNKPSAPSAHDVARAAGVSQAAVSRAFTPGASIAPKTREKVLAAAKAIGYRPNLLARSLIKGTSGIIGVVVGNTTDPLVGEALNTLSVQLSTFQKHLLVFTAEETANADHQVEDLLRYRVDALLMMTSTLSYQLAEKCLKESIPVIFMNRQHGRNRLFSSVLGNNRLGARTLANHLVDQGYRRIAVVSGHKDSTTSCERESAFCAQLKKRDLIPVAVETGMCQRQPAAEAVKRLLDSKNRPDAIFCVNDLMALATLEVARFEFGLSIGPELGVVGFDDIEQAAWPSFDLTTYSHPVSAMVNEALSLLLSDERPSGAQHTLINGDLKVRGSTCRVRSTHSR